MKKEHGIMMCTGKETTGKGKEEKKSNTRVIPPYTSSLRMRHQMDNPRYHGHLSHKVHTIY